MRDPIVTENITLAHALITTGLVDEYRLFVRPVALGHGRRPFADATGKPCLGVCDDCHKCPSPLRARRHIASFPRPFGIFFVCCRKSGVGDEMISQSISIRTERSNAPAQIGVDVSDNRSTLLSQRAAVIFLLGALTAIGAGVLTFFNGGTPASSTLVGGAAFGAAVTFFHTVID
ncbi:dihydrofolate reductase family protein [Streptomyces sp. Je 1-4]|uniref:dihydrofolate reductase family protein n=1 Tax=Streptomyces TaxID=1883 RepID=UPI0021D8B9EE|nr:MULTISPECIES: dihydrofolate reductase family protein [unclassified Streptomyces]UYB38256.1 dihydrofolate reductase family protein [Streptomyces sp. Je 1-4]UZQ34203.1 dihydrofolate reductase family protein [Streptomyces sp. Je 1-4] [Streptomyces sp. Je 1-4 4N24]UZQ41621.1 dihydrofolate reductase family protein [Streptomyces sp. Je 1-4] [Streptomyces sp. Je 1-4 4N24_ara]